MLWIPSQIRCCTLHGTAQFMPKLLISTGHILPEHRAFRNGEPRGLLPDDRNSMAAQQRTGAPEIILRPKRTDSNCIMQLIALADWMALFKDHKHLVIPYPPGGALADWLPAVPLDYIIAVIAFLLKFIPQSHCLPLLSAECTNNSSPSFVGSLSSMTMSTHCPYCHSCGARSL